MKSQVVLLFAVLLVLAPFANCQTTQPSNDRRLKMRANQAFNRGEYSIALPLLKKLAEDSKDQPSRLGAIEEQIRVCQKALDSLKKKAPADGQAALAKLNPSDPAMDAETRHPHPAPKPGEVLEMSIKELGNFQYDADLGGHVPADVKRLNGATIRLHGYMIPMDQAQNISQFALVPSLFSCCFGQPPQIQHTIVINCPKGKAVEYCPDEVIVQGKLTVEEKKDDGYVVSLFEVAADSVKVAK